MLLPSSTNRGAAAQEIARNAAQASNQASDARHLAVEGQQVVERKIKAMSQSVASATKEQTSVVESINVDITFDQHAQSGRRGKPTIDPARLRRPGTAGDTTKPCASGDARCT